MVRVGLMCAAVGVSSVAAFAAPVSSTFDSNVDGWVVTELVPLPAGANPATAGTYAPTYSATGGNPGGYISASDQSTNDYYFTAPAKFLGNQIASLGGTISFDFNDINGNGALNTGVSPIILVGATESLYRSDELSVPSTFTHYSYPLSAPNGWTVNAQGGPTASNADFAAVLGSLQAIYILGDRINAGDTASLDNVVLSPEPASLAILSGGVMLLVRRRARA